MTSLARWRERAARTLLAAIGVVSVAPAVDASSVAAVALESALAAAPSPLGIELGIEGGGLPVFDVGTQFRYTIRTSTDAHVALISHEADGQAYLLLPSQQSSMISGAVWHTLPGDDHVITASVPGTDHVQAIACLDAASLAALLGPFAGGVALVDRVAEAWRTAAPGVAGRCVVASQRVVTRGPEPIAAPIAVPIAVPIAEPSAPAPRPTPTPPVAEVVTVRDIVGTAELGDPRCREAAFSDAFHQAVAKGVGVDVLSDSRVRDMQLAHDLVLVRSFGHVRDYQVREQGRDDERGICWVRIDATVVPGAEETRNALAAIVARQTDPPRVALEVREQMAGIGGASDAAEGWFERAFRAVDLEILAPGGSPAPEYRMVVTVDGSYLGTEAYAGSKVHAFELAATIEVLSAYDGSSVLVEVLPPGRVTSTRGDAAGAAADAIERYLGGGDGGDPAGGAWRVFTRLLAAELTEADLGRMVRLELDGVTDSNLRQVEEQLGRVEEIQEVWRVSTSDAGAVLEIGTTLTPEDLREAVAGALSGRLTELAAGFAAIRYGSRPEPRGAVLLSVLLGALAAARWVMS